MARPTSKVPARLYAGLTKTGKVTTIAYTRKELKADGFTRETIVALAPTKKGSTVIYRDTSNLQIVKSTAAGEKLAEKNTTGGVVARYGFAK